MSALTSLIVLIAAIGLSVYQFRKGSLIRASFAFIAAICAGAVSLGFYELLANFAVSNIAKEEPNAVIPWLYPAFFLFIFLLVFALLQALISTLLKSVIDIGQLPEKIGRALVGLITGYYIAGIVIAAMVIAPLPRDLPNERFDANITLGTGANSSLGAESFAISLTKLVTGGSLSGSKNVASVHPHFLDEMYVNRLAKHDKPLMVGVGQDISITGNFEELEELQSTDPNIADMEAPSGHKFVAITVKISGRDSFSMGQVRLLSKSKEQAARPLSGRSDAAIALGVLTSNGMIKNFKPTETLDAGKDAFKLVFAIPAANQPTAITYKLTKIVLVPKKRPVTSSENQPITEEEQKEETESSD
jgi:hypothetical protein